MASYVRRWQRRATPSGLFAGIGVAGVGPAKADVGTRHQAVTRVDGEWPTALIDRLEQHPGLRSRLTVVVDDARILRDGRVIVHRRAEIGAFTPGHLLELVRPAGRRTGRRC